MKQNAFDFLAVSALFEVNRRLYGLQVKDTNLECSQGAGVLVQVPLKQSLRWGFFFKWFFFFFESALWRRGIEEAERQAGFR